MDDSHREGWIRKTMWSDRLLSVPTLSSFFLNKPLTTSQLRLLLSPSDIPSSYSDMKINYIILLINFHLFGSL